MSSRLLSRGVSGWWALAALASAVVLSVVPAARGASAEPRRAAVPLESGNLTMPQAQASSALPSGELAMGALPASALPQGALPQGALSASALPLGVTALDDKDKKEEPAVAKFSAEVLVLHATNAGKGIDKRIGEMPQLKKPPFSSYDSYELLIKETLPLIKSKPAKLTLPNKRVLQTELLAELPKDYVKLSASINQPGGKDFLPLLEVKAKAGQSFIVAGQSYQGGILVLVIRVLLTPKDDKGK
ncbi:MAG: hypothetical protein KF915_17225 [Polyangiaceae bacterium]|nr:hypothetical protein [Polyangiaceae bacterium]